MIVISRQARREVRAPRPCPPSLLCLDAVASRASKPPPHPVSCFLCFRPECELVGVETIHHSTRQSVRWSCRQGSGSSQHPYGAAAGSPVIQATNALPNQYCQVRIHDHTVTRRRAFNMLVGVLLKYVAVTALLMPSQTPEVGGRRSPGPWCVNPL